MRKSKDAQLDSALGESSAVVVGYHLDSRHENEWMRTITVTELLAEAGVWAGPGARGGVFQNIKK